MKIQAQVIADSLSPQGNRLTSLLITFPRFILAELNTHRMLSKNSASSRAIPTHKLLKMVEENPFIPIAWQKEHKGMQGTEYITDKDTTTRLLNNYLGARNNALEAAKAHVELGATKQLANRFLEPFMWHTVLISGTEWGNFFELRCPQYVYGGKYFRSWKDLVEFERETGDKEKALYLETETSLLSKLSINTGQAEIHMMALAEAIWDAINENKPKQLQAGEWHIPFGNKLPADNDARLSGLYPFDYDGFPNKAMYDFIQEVKVKLATAMAARTSYTVVGDEKEVSYETLLGIHDKMAVAKPFHASPFEHCARAMNDKEYYSNIKGEYPTTTDEWGIVNYERYPLIYKGMFEGEQEGINKSNPDIYGWCRNYRGFIQYRHILENKIQ